MRIFADDSGAMCGMSDKYGVWEENCMPLLRKAKELNMNVIGIW